MKAILKRYSKCILTPLLILAICFASAAPPIEVEAKTSARAQAERPVKNFYKYAKQLNVNKMYKYVAPSSSSGSSLSSKEQKQVNKLGKIIKKQNKKRFSYKIVSTKLSGDKKSATVKVKVKYRSLYRAGYYGMANTTLRLYQYYFSHNNEPSDSKMLEWLVKYVNQGVKKYSAKKVTKTITVHTKKYGSGWKIVSVTDEMSNTCTCDILKSFDDFAKELD